MTTWDAPGLTTEVFVTVQVNRMMTCRFSQLITEIYHVQACPCSVEDHDAKNVGSNCFSSHYADVIERRCGCTPFWLTTSWKGLLLSYYYKILQISVIFDPLSVAVAQR